MKVYIAGAYTPQDGQDETRQLNIDFADLAARWALLLGHTPFCPHSMTRGWGDMVEYERIMELCLEWLRACEAIVLLPGWHASPGACREHAEAQRLHLRIYDMEQISFGRAGLPVAKEVAPCN